eukprot:851991-Pleurochrysis_carterae.AAC.1
MEERLARSDWGRLVRESGGAEAVWGAGAYRPSDWSEATQRLLLAIDAAASRARERRTTGRGENQAALWQTERDLPAGST